MEVAGTSLALVLGRVVTTGPDSGAPVGGEIGWVWAFDEAGLANEMRAYIDPAAAREDFRARGG